MSITQSLTPEAELFSHTAADDAELAYRVLRETGTLSSNGTIVTAERIPGQDAYVLLRDPGPWSDEAIEPVVLDFDGNILSGDPAAGGGGFGFEQIFRLWEDVTTVVHVHTPHLGAWSQTHQPLPIRYVPVQRWTLGTELPIYIDRTQSQVDFIIERLAENPHVPAILEANGGATVWGREGLLATAEYIQLLEEGAQFQILARALGGSQEFGPGVLIQQWKMSGLVDQAKAEGLLPEE